MAAEIWVNDGGVARQIREVWVNDNGTARRIQEIWVNDSGTARQVFVSDVVSISDLIAYCETSSPGPTATATYRLESDGDIGATEANNTVNDVGDWIAPKTNMANYECRADVTSGTLSSGTTGAWQSLSTTRTWTRINAGTGTIDAVFTLQIRRASDAVVVATASITLRAARFAP